MNVAIDLPGWFIYPYLFVFGAIIGSFLNVCIYRIPPHDRLWDQLKSLWERPSQCPRCGTGIRWFDNVPIFGWLFLRGRCRQCRMAISPRYPFIELLNACLWMLVFWLEVPIGYGQTLEDSCLSTPLGPEHFPGLGPLSPEWFVILRYVFHMFLIEALLVASMIDFDFRIIPSSTTDPWMWIAVLISATVARVHLVPVWFQGPRLKQTFSLIMPDWVLPWLDGPAVPEWINAHPHLHGFLVSFVGLLVGGASVWAVRIMGGWVLRQEAMGKGDVYLMAMIGAFLGWQASIIAFFIAPLCALMVFCVSVIFRPERMIPYGPYLSLGALLTLLGWKHVFARVHQIFELGVLLFPLAGFMAILFLLSLMTVQVGKWTFGYRLVPEEEQGYWRSADQTFFFKGETVHRHTGRWRTDDWDGCAAGQGLI
ncbi:MAG: prepilin peptidase, partial [Planctomycetaceae bacterium]|nr:prepilin peptidase [Planctomycetaceae bacterium]